MDGWMDELVKKRMAERMDASMDGQMGQERRERMGQKPFPPEFESHRSSTRGAHPPSVFLPFSRFPIPRCSRSGRMDSNFHRTKGFSCEIQKRFIRPFHRAFTCLAKVSPREPPLRCSSWNHSFSCSSEFISLSVNGIIHPSPPSSVHSSICA